jgi:V/A-type H+-transporting ATPase subunit G/H
MGDSPVTRADTLLQIKDAEAKASQIMKEADDKQKTTVAAARKDAIRKIQDADEKQRSEFDAAYASEKATVSSQREEILEKGKREARELKSKAETNIPKAKSHLKQAFEGSI